MTKTLIKNVKLLDGVNFFGENYSIITENGRIEEIICAYSINEANFSRIVDGRNQFLAPAFIDVHSHSDMSILSPFELTSKKSSGFGAEIVGNCGLSCFPISSKNCDNLKKVYQKYPTAITWSSAEEYLSLTQNNRSKTEIFSLTGHNTLHSAVATYEKRSCTADELKSMQKLLQSTLDAGSLGLSLGLLYSPGRFAEDFEIVELMKIVAQNDKIVCTHLKSEGDFLIESLTQTLEFARRASLQKLHISHLKTSGEANFYKLEKVFEIIENAPKNYGVSVTFDRYPFCQSLTQLSVAGPEKFLSTPDSKIMEILQNSETECQVFKETLQKKGENYLSKIILVSTQLADYQKFIGLKITQIAELISKNPCDIILELVKYDSVNSLAAFETMSEENMRQIIAHPLCMIGTDETARPLGQELGSSHIRNYGSSAEFIKILRQLKLDNSFIIKKLSYNAAKRFSLPFLGEIKKNNQAKFVLIDFDNVKNNASFASPHTPSDGITLLEEI